MSTIEAIESLQATLEPIQELWGEHTHMESWVNESFQALETLHSELAEWQSMLSRKQTELDMREDSLEDFRGEEKELQEQVDQWESQLTAAREEIQQLEDENAEQLQELESLERNQVLLETEIQSAGIQVEELTAALASEQANSTEGHQQWKDEFQQLRSMLERQFQLLSQQLGHEEPTVLADQTSIQLETEPSIRSAELRRRAESRRAKRLQQQGVEESPES